MACAQVGDVIDIVFRNSLPNAVNLVLNGGLIPDSPSYLTAAINPGQTVRCRQNGLETLSLKAFPA
jgi:hypothetical protein